ncbi:hypothetical protein JZO77_04535 [Enterococcus hulanensis]|uniref:HpcH/HpaI aldolase family protein n=1 Tax=Enterococcus hulanensis TaxID=2559929 RepID=UPI001A8E7E8E|nr:aldolase/citrate lyase family protein [Enterococcus hulanensis]MBO0456003.1 hypothetical protein [Enterococcus hulanensis]
MKINKNWKSQMLDKPLFGCFVTYGLPDIAEFTASLGFDFLLIDNEHGVMEQSVILDMVRASQGMNVPAVVRCESSEFGQIQKSLDFDANGVQMPLVNTKKQAQKVVELANFPPVGKRGVAFLPRAAQFGLINDKKRYLEEANRTKFVCCQIETRQSLENLDDILTVEGIDVFFIGPGDLSVSLGMNTSDEEFIEILKNTVQKIVSNGRVAGCYVGNYKEAERAISWGATYLVTAITPYMAAGAQQFLNAVQKKDTSEVKVMNAY